MKYEHCKVHLDWSLFPARGHGGVEKRAAVLVHLMIYRISIFFKGRILQYDFLLQSDGQTRD